MKPEKVTTLRPRLELNDEQRAAFEQLMPILKGDQEEKIAVLAGFAGTGKTTLVGEIARALTAADITVAVCAPTHKAVSVLREKLQAAGGCDWVQFETVHALLALRLIEKDDGTAKCEPSGMAPIIDNFSVVVVDESSMLGEDLYNRLLMQRRGTRILFVGDPMQLPPVDGAKQQLSPVFVRTAYQVTLSKVVRQAEGNPIIGLSIAIRHAIERNERVTANMIQQHLPPPPAPAAFTGGGSQTAIDWALYERNEGRDARILCFTNRQVIDVNQQMHSAIYGRTNRPFEPGQAVIVHESREVKFAPQEDGLGIGHERVTLHTSEELEVVSIGEARTYAGETAIPIRLRREDGNEIVGYIPGDPDDLRLKIDKLFGDARKLKMDNKPFESKDAARHAWTLKKSFLELRHPYAMTVHKSQGSTFDTALVDYGDICKMRETFDFNRSLYVAITRPSKFLAIVA